MWPTPNEIETYVRDPEALTPDTSERIEQLLEEDAGIRALVEFFRIFYEEFDSQEGKTSEAVAAFIDEIAPLPLVVPLYRIDSPFSLDTFHVVLAAKTQEESAPVQQAAVLISPDKEIVVRVLTEGPDVIRVYAISSDRSLTSNALLNILPHGILCAIDSSGKALIVRGQEKPLSIDRVDIYPVQSRVFINAERLTDQADASFPNVAFQIGNHGASRYLPDVDVVAPRYIGIKLSGGTKVIQVDAEYVTIRLDESDRHIEVLFYG